MTSDGRLTFGAAAAGVIVGFLLSGAIGPWHPVHADADKLRPPASVNEAHHEEDPMQRFTVMDISIASQPGFLRCQETRSWLG